ncbi:glycoside hydrolase family 18 protein [Fusarium avenaceum]|nr:glycoside hydrolase family 18 protein [Fusarium avenaceum]
MKWRVRFLKRVSTALILSGFDASDDNHLHSTATYQLLSIWASDYGDVTFTKGNYLYDTGGNKIFNQRYGSLDSHNNVLTINLYASAPAPPDTQKVCAAASRYVDDIVYDEKTSTVWPDGTGEDTANITLPVVGSIVEELFGINYGYTIIRTYKSSENLSRGVTGKDIKQAVLNIYALDGAKGCGSTYRDNGYHITVNGCNNCRDVGRQVTLWNSYHVANGSFGEAAGGVPSSN